MPMMVRLYSLNDEEYNTDLTAEAGPFDSVQLTYGLVRGLREGEREVWVAQMDLTHVDWVVGSAARRLGEGSSTNGNDGHFSDIEIVPVEETP